MSKQLEPYAGLTIDEVAMIQNPHLYQTKKQPIVEVEYLSPEEMDKQIKPLTQSEFFAWNESQKELELNEVVELNEQGEYERVR